MDMDGVDTGGFSPVVPEERQLGKGAFEMHKSTLRRGGASVVFLAGIGAAVFGLSSVAQASNVLYQNDNANVRVSGGEATALNECINDAKDGYIQTQQNSCDQVATSGNVVTLENVNVYVQRATFPFVLLYRNNNVTVEMTGGAMDAINSCVNDARDGVIQTQLNACKQVATAGGLVTAIGSSVVVRSAG